MVQLKNGKMEQVYEGNKSNVQIFNPGATVSFWQLIDNVCVILCLN